MAGEVYKVIIADDSAVVRSVVREILKANAGFEIIAEAENGQQALNAIAENPEADGLLLDIHLGDMTGVDVLKEVDVGAAHLAVVMLTGVSDSTVVRDCLQHGAKGYMLKDETNWHLSLVERLEAAIERVRARIRKDS